MKIRTAIIILFALANTHCSSVNSNMQRYYDYQPSCNCADIACKRGNPCLNGCECCKAFGNIGKNQFEPLEESSTSYASFESFSSIRTPVVSARRSYKGE
jgi:hypothetical protein